MSFDTSRSSSIALDDNEPKPLHLVAWGSGSLSHWAIFVPDMLGSPDGMLFHIGVEAQSSGFAFTTDVRLACHPFKVAASGANRSFPIREARATSRQVDEAASYVYASYRRYNIVTRNCQNFALDVLLRLNQLNPSAVPAEAIQDVRSRGTISTVLASILRRTQLAYPAAPGQNRNQNRCGQNHGWVIVSSLSNPKKVPADWAIRTPCIGITA
ncbi:hypothetical protein BO78DRAFT_381720 [Aspergillus sclerotiicarbonarius CBS 121057]|uniref:DUF862-domain-containing protein n=1 Tax=Aspergillus sclerotiicarbonarius (strain CBS 121057 / IBT 28362) TaxID=1448318 RepID=A0A319EQG3_ASPSB|nr:hypothetical protein BO78DRAFT_381720 [Aspergillus sclerotiicarbonarius CBS 121057]